jgi:hypothetical protein
MTGIGGREEGGGAEGKSLGKDGDIYDAERRKRYI